MPPSTRPQVSPHAPEAREEVLELCEFDLVAGLGGARAAGEDVQDQLGAVNDLAVGDFFEVANLGGAEVHVEDDHIGAGLPAEFGQLLDLALAEIGRAVREPPMLNQLPRHNRVGGPGETPQLLERFARNFNALRRSAHQHGAFCGHG